MTNINWANFKAKFFERESKAFEELSYLLFCSEFKIKSGLFRYKNQTGIETDPVSSEGKRIGFQAKYYDTKISANKEDILDSLKKAKAKDASIEIIYVYLNQEFSESRKKDSKAPQYKIELEKDAKKLGLTIVWRVNSNFEILLNQQENKHIREYFFETGKNAFDFLNEIKRHTERVILPIHYNITLKDATLEIDRSTIVQEILDDKSPLIILSGDGGSGKTAVVKKLYELSTCPFYIFKAAEFNLQSIVSLFKNYGDYTLNDFLTLHEDQPEKCIVIDSAEKLSDLENQDPFNEFLSATLVAGWRIIFTTRLSYLEDLRYQFVEVYKKSFNTIKLDNLRDIELQEIAKKYGFQLPSDTRLKKLISNLFYLGEYLKNTHNAEQKLDYEQFKEDLWNRKIQHSTERKNNIHIEREKCFIALAKKRANDGTFFNQMQTCLPTALSKLEADEVIKYDTTNGGYFITHDIYEEWALNRIIETEYALAIDYPTFFNTIGTSLPIRRAFRSWLSDKLLGNIIAIQPLIDQTVFNPLIEIFWRDELLVAVLLSDYSWSFFDTFENKILEDQKILFKRILFLLQIGCMQVHDILFQDRAGESEPPYLITQPKGEGWNSCINFIFSQKEKFDKPDVERIVGLLKEWTDSFKKGDTTRKIGLLALYFYKKTQEDDDWGYTNELEKKLEDILLSSAIEIKDELTEIYNRIIASERHSHNDSFYGLTEKILTSTFDVIPMITVMPNTIIAIAEKLWFRQKSNKTNPFEYEGHGVEKYYQLNHSSHMDYHPASALQTPVYRLLKNSLRDSIDFILRFTNRAVENYLASNFENLKEVELIIDSKTKVKQLASESLWQMFRGNSSPVTPYLLQSIHMALEKFFLENFSEENATVCENWLIYMLKESRSVSISAVVASVALAHPEKLFNVLKILFRTDIFFYYDNVRQSQEFSAKRLYSIGAGMSFKTKIFDNERIRTCDEPHRKLTLEQIAFKFQLINSEGSSEEEFTERKKEILNILDEYYSRIPKKYLKRDKHNTLRLLLARLDTRKMKPAFKEDGDNILISFDTDLDPKLKKDSEEAIEHSHRNMTHLSLKHWAAGKLEDNNSYGNYPQYEGNPSSAMNEVKEVVNKLRSECEEEFYRFNHSTPAYACSALIQYYSDVLTFEDLDYCRGIIIEEVTTAFHESYQYQIGDGVEVAVNSLPKLIKLFPEQREEFTGLLLLIMMDEYPIGNYKRVCDYAVEAVQNKLWNISFEDAQSVFLGFLRFKPEYDSVREQVVKNARRHGFFNKSVHSATLRQWFSEKGDDIEKILQETLVYSDITLPTKMQTLNTGLQMLPINTQEETHKSFAAAAVEQACKELLDRNREDSNDQIDYTLGLRFFKKFAGFMLNRKPEDIPVLIKPLVENFRYTEQMATVIQEFVGEEDVLNTYEPFWMIWHHFYEPIKIFCQASEGNRFVEKIVHNYLLAWPWWKETAKDWRSLKARETTFFRNAAQDMGNNSAVLYSIAKFLNDIGSKFTNEGMLWISDLLSNNPNYYHRKLPTNTVYYLERVVRKYAFHNRTILKKNMNIRSKLLVILNFLIEKGSVNAYLLREDII